MHVVLDEIRSEKALWYEVYMTDENEHILPETDEVFGTLDAAMNYLTSLVTKGLRNDQ